MHERRTFLAATAGAIASLGTARRAAGRGGPAPGKTKTFVLLHGAWHGGWCWSRVAEPLRAAGHRVYTPTQTGLGERSHLISRNITLDVFVQDLVNVFEWEDLNDVILVGHSFGGLATTGATDRIPKRIRHIVFLDSFTVPSGQSAFDAMPADVAEARRQLAQEFSGGVMMPVPEPKAFGIMAPADAAWLKAKCTPHPLQTYETRLTLKNPIGNGLPVTYVAVKPDYGPTVAARQYAKTRKDWNYIELLASHDAMVDQPQAVIDIISTL
jgi:pimeloyl-ACP methyl ester carboxylesterase